jgi:hypothetical protein
MKMMEGTPEAPEAMLNQATKKKRRKINQWTRRKRMPQDKQVCQQGSLEEECRTRLGDSFHSNGRIQEQAG